MLVVLNLIIKKIIIISKYKIYFNANQKSDSKFVRFRTKIAGVGHNFLILIILYTQRIRILLTF